MQRYEQRIGQRMKELREENHLSQAEIAEICQTNQSTIARMETGKTAPTVKVLICLADYYKVSMDYLCCRTDRPQGELYEYNPKIKISDDAMKQFIDMCFDPKSPVSYRVKESMLEIFKEENKK